MFSFTNDGRWQNDRVSPSHYPSTSRQQHVQIVSNSSQDELQWTSEPRPDSYVPISFAPETASWLDAALSDLPFSTNVYAGGVWLGDQRLDGGLSEPSFSAPVGNADGPGTSPLVGMGVVARVEPVIPAMQSALPVFQPSPSGAVNWTQAPGQFWQPTHWELPARTAGQHGGHSGSVDSLGTEPDTTHFQMAVPSTTTGHPGRRIMQTGRLPSMAAPHSVQPWTHSDPVLAASPKFRPHGERWDLSRNTTPTTFQCLWTSGETWCMAPVAGDRKSVSSHLRDEHGFTCDGRMIACAWDRCTTRMQRRNIPRHIIACHFEIKVTCSRCGMALSRADANKKHQLGCTGGAANTTAVTEEDDRRLFFF